MDAVQSFLCGDDDIILRYHRRMASIGSDISSAFEVVGDTTPVHMEPIEFLVGAQYRADIWNVDVLSKRNGPHYMRTVIEFYADGDYRTATAKFPVLQDLAAFEHLGKSFVKTNDPELFKAIDLRTELYLEAISKHGYCKLNMEVERPERHAIITEFLGMMEEEVMRIAKEPRGLFGLHERRLHKRMFERIDKFGLDHKLTFE